MRSFILSTKYICGIHACIHGVDFTLGNPLFGAIKLIKYADPDKYSYSRYVTEFEHVGGSCYLMVVGLARAW